MKSIILATIFFLLLVSQGGAQDSQRKASDPSMLVTESTDQTAINVTVYNSGSGLVRDVRSIDFPNGMVELKFMDVASGIDPTSVHFSSLTNPQGIAIWEQNYEYDLIDKAKLLEKYIGKKISFKEINPATGKEEIKDGILLSTQGGYTLQMAEQIYIKNLNEIILSKLPEGLITRPTLAWLLDVAGSGKQKVEMSYLTTGLTWNANYVVVINENDTALGLNGWVTINNTSGATYNDASLKLVAGDVHRVSPPKPMRGEMMMSDGMGKAASAPAFEEKSFFEYHLYTLQRPATLKNNQQKQIALLEANKVPAKKLFIYEPSGDYWYGGDTQTGKIQVKIQFKNSKENGVGIPIPKGIVRVYKADTDGSLQLIGEDSIDHTPKDEEVRLFLGEAFDIVGERVLKNRRKISDRIWEYDVQITLRNHKTEPVTITVIDHVSWGDWSVIKSSTDWNKKDASTLEFPVKVAKDGEVKITYTVRREY